MFVVATCLNLRIKRKQGKRFDFTDPDGNADRLFVFQRDVDKARERLKKGDPSTAQPWAHQWRRDVNPDQFQAP